MRKQRGPSKLMQLPQAQQDALFRWLEMERMTYPQALARLQSEFAVKSNRTAICEFRQQVIQRRLTQPASAAAASNGATVFEIVIESTAPNILRLKIISSAAIHIERGTG